LVRRDDHTFRCGHAVYKIEVVTWSPFVEEPATLTEHKRMDEQHVSVDEVCGK
jgi:hypothetical protein